MTLCLQKSKRLPLMTEALDYPLPKASIAQEPLLERDLSRLLVCKAIGRLGEFSSVFEYQHKSFRDIISMLGPQNLLIVNDAKVLPVRLHGHRVNSDGSLGGAVEALLLSTNEQHNSAVALLHLSAHVKPGLRFVFEPGLLAEVQSTNNERQENEGQVKLTFSGLALARMSLHRWLQNHGHVPLPPYISRQENREDRTQYQTIYAAKLGSAAAPTAGFHFTPELMKNLRIKGVRMASITLHVGLGTFRPIKVETLEEHQMHEEQYEISSDFIEEYTSSKKEGRRVVAVGTTVVRALESWATDSSTNQKAGCFSTSRFIKPGTPFVAVDDLITNFHLPRSSLLALVGAAMGVDSMKKAYEIALHSGYRFLSYGDAMFIRGGKI